MSARQMRFFPHPKPLTAKLGRDFFRELPRQPGVYLMFDRADRLVYVGKSKNLRLRLGSYRAVNPERAAARTVRLVHAVERITYEVCENVCAAELREAEMLRTHRPRFNVLNVFPGVNFFITFHLLGDDCTIGYSRAAPDHLQAYGAFKSGGLLGYSALVRMLWNVCHGFPGLDDFPAGLLSVRPPRQRSFSLPHDLRRLVPAYLSGEERGLIDFFRAQKPARPFSKFEESLLENDLGELERFFDVGCRRNWILRRHYAIPQTIAQEQLDDLVIRFRHQAILGISPENSTPPGF